MQGCFQRAEHSLSLPLSHTCPLKLSSSDSLLSVPFSTHRSSYLNIGETHRSPLLNVISSLLSKTFHSSGSGKEEKHRQGRHISSPVTLRAEALFPLGVASPSISFLPLLHWFLFASSSLQLAIKQHFLLLDLSCYHTEVFIYNLGHNFYILDHMTGRVYYCVSLEFPQLRLWT